MSSGKGALVLGAGGHGKVVVSTLQAAGIEVVAILDGDRARWGEAILGVAVRGPFSAWEETTCRQAVLAVGDNRSRQRLAAELPLDWITVVHPRAYVHPSVTLGAGTVVFAGAIVQPDSRVGEHAILNTAASVDHDCRIGDFAHLAPGVRLAGSVTVEEGALLGVGTVAIPGRSIGAWATVGAGSVVIRDVAAGARVAGNPATPLPGRRATMAP